jgi:hypothetical protein
MKEFETIKNRLTEIQKEENPELKHELLLQLRNELNSILLQLFEEKLFSEHSVPDVMDDLQKMFFAYICDENTNAFDRQTATVSFKLLSKTLTAINQHKDPDDINFIRINPAI